MSNDELVEVKEILYDGEFVAVPQGNMWALFRVVHDKETGDTSFDWEGLTTLTGAHNTFRRARK